MAATPRVSIELRDLATGDPIPGVIVSCDWHVMDRGAWLHGGQEHVHNWRSITDRNGRLEIPPYECGKFDGAYVSLSAAGQHPIFPGKLVTLGFSPFLRERALSAAINDGITNLCSIQGQDGGAVVVRRFLQSYPESMKGHRIHVRYAPDKERCAVRIDSGGSQWFFPMLRCASSYYKSVEFREEIEAFGPRKADVFKVLSDVAAAMYSDAKEFPVFDETVLSDETQVKFVARETKD